VDDLLSIFQFLVTGFTADFMKSALFKIKQPMVKVIRLRQNLLGKLRSNFRGLEQHCACLLK
jgi:hypothetical protein